MKTILKIFKRDLIALVTRFFPLAIALGVCLLPSLYAWFNIYSNWDPYANTANIQIAVFSEDKGYTDEDGNYSNTGESIIDGLKENTSIGWVFPESEEETLEGVYSGEYYAAIVVDENFSYDMYNAFDQNFENPILTYYENEKKNAVATKITDTAVATVKQNVNQQFISVVVSTLFESTNEIAKDLNDITVISEIIDKLTEMQTKIATYNTLLEDLEEAQNVLSEELADTEDQISQASSEVAGQKERNREYQSKVSAAEASFADYENEINTKSEELKSRISALKQTVEAENAAAGAEASQAAAQAQTQLDQSGVTDAAEQAAGQAEAQTAQTKEEIAARLQSVETQLNSMESMLDEMQNAAQSDENVKQAVETYQSSIDEMQQTVTSAKTDLENYPAQKQALLAEIQTLETDQENLLESSKEKFISTLNQAFNGIDDLLDQVGTGLDDAGLVVKSSDETATAASVSMSAVGAALSLVDSRLSDVIDKVDVIRMNGAADILINFLKGDPETYGEFFSEPVEVTTEAVYPVENYGSAVAPFYSVLAIWVGCTVLVSIIKVKVPDHYLGNASPTQLFFGRYLLFLFLSELQTVIIVLGDIFLLHCQILHPFLFYLTAALASLAFSMIVYSLTLAFGDIGKAAAVIIMVIQIAGSGGTYPIEILPDFYRNVYIFFPFPYAINAMRETIGGLYQLDYLKYMLQLSVFVAAGLAIGLLFRLPFIKLAHFFEERMEDTEMM